jgi:hypothetical protein
MSTMFDPQMELVSTAIVALAAQIDTDPDAWTKAGQALHASAVKEPDLQAAIEARDAAQLRTIVEQWGNGKRHLPEHDREVLKRAMKAFRKSFKVTRLDAESSIGGGPMSGGRLSAIVGITPPARYPRAVWDELVRQGRLRDGKRGIYELPPE